MSFGNSLRRMYWFVSSQMGIDPLRTIRSARGVPRYLRDLKRFRSMYDGSLVHMPCLSDWNQQSGSCLSEYFWQDLLVAQMVAKANPILHVDIGSRIDGFVTHVASFREIEVLDIRPLSAAIPGVTFQQIDIMHAPPNLAGYCDSISCLHTLEHFGLGRYGDQLDVAGYRTGFRNMVMMLNDHGHLYLSVPLGRQCVRFNGNWVFDPVTIIELGQECSMELVSLRTIHPSGEIVTIEHTENSIAAIQNTDYVLGLFLFERNDQSTDHNK